MIKIELFHIRYLMIISCLILPLKSLLAQYNIDDVSTVTLGQDEKAYNPILTAVPFLMISPDSRAAGLGDAGVASSPDINSMYWNPAKYAYMPNQMGVAVSFTPWLKKLVSDMYIGKLSGFYKFDNLQTVAATMTYFDYGSINFTDNNGDYIMTHNPNEWTIDVAYARRFSNKVSGSIAFRYIRSDLTGGYSNSGSESSAGNSFAADVAFFYSNPEVVLFEKDVTWNVGLNISNIGTKISYTQDEDDFIPTNMRLGTSFNFKLDQYNSIAFIFDANKLLVPTQPEYYPTGSVLPSGDTVTDSDNIILYGMDPDVSVPVGMLQSFYDSPGIAKDDGSRSVFREELQEVSLSVGLEYWYADKFAIRLGYFNEHERKGNRKYMTFGAGVKTNVVGFDFAYLVPFYTDSSPLANTVRFSLLFDIGDEMPVRSIN